MNGLDIFSGIGGISYALQEWIKPLAYCEKDEYCQKVLLSRMFNYDIQFAPIWDDIITFPSSEFLGHMDIIYGGFPCQDISIAGNGKGLEGKRSGLFFEIVRLADEIKPKFIFIANVPAITSRGGLQIVKEIADLGYDCRWCIISAASVGALHQRKRWFLLAHSSSSRCNEEQRKLSIGSTVAYSKFTDSNIQNGNADSIAGEQTNTQAESIKIEKSTWRGPTGQYRPFESREHWQTTVSEMGKCSHGIPNHVDRLRALGNAVVPQQVRKAFKILMGIR